MSEYKQLALAIGGMAVGFAVLMAALGAPWWYPLAGAAWVIPFVLGLWWLLDRP